MQRGRLEKNKTMWGFQLIIQMCELVDIWIWEITCIRLIKTSGDQWQMWEDQQTKLYNHIGYSKKIARKAFSVR